ncbi:MAG: gene transfer agent family protein [Hyphomicrobium sp.]
MANAHRGEIEARLDGKTFRLVLTLGALAELEAAFGDDDMLALASRFEKGRLSARDCVRVIGAGLRGAGYDIADEAVRAMQADNGAAGFVDTVARLLRATFGGDDAEPPQPAPGNTCPRASAEEPPPGEPVPGPFPGPT